MKPIIIDNFLEEEPFNVLTNLICEDHGVGDLSFPWHYAQYNTPGGQYQSSQTSGHKSPITDYFFTHVFYVNGLQSSKHMGALVHFVEKIKTLEGTPEEKQRVKEFETDWLLHGGIIKAILRMRANLFVNTSTVYEYPMHEDYDEEEDNQKSSKK